VNFALCSLLQKFKVQMRKRAFKVQREASCRLKKLHTDMQRSCWFKVQGLRFKKKQAAGEIKVMQITQIKQIFYKFASVLLRKIKIRVNP